MGDRIRVQIYTAQSSGEAVDLARAGVDHVGVTPSDHGLPGEVDFVTAREVCEALSGLATSVALSVETDIEAITAMVRQVRPEILHLCGPPGAVGPDAVSALRGEIAPVDVMQAVAVTGPEAIDVAVSYASVADYLLLDSVAPGIPGVGAAGTVHDWDLSAAIVDAVDIPVILAGGLSPTNVAHAIEVVGPWGVDSLTHTNRTLAAGGFRKDLDLVRRFVTAARGAGS